LDINDVAKINNMAKTLKDSGLAGSLKEAVTKAEYMILGKKEEVEDVQEVVKPDTEEELKNVASLFSEESEIDDEGLGDNMDGIQKVNEIFSGTSEDTKETTKEESNDTKETTKEAIEESPDDGLLDDVMKDFDEDMIRTNDELKKMGKLDSSEH